MSESKKDIRRRKKQVKERKEQDKKDRKTRGKKGYCTRDTFGFDTYLAGVIAGGVKELRDRQFGVPSNIEEEEWNTILDKIALGFAKYAVDSDGGMHFGYEKEPEFIEAMQLFQEYFPALWD